MLYITYVSLVIFILIPNFESRKRRKRTKKIFQLVQQLLERMVQWLSKKMSLEALLLELERFAIVKIAGYLL